MHRARCVTTRSLATREGSSPSRTPGVVAVLVIGSPSISSLAGFVHFCRLRAERRSRKQAIGFDRCLFSCLFASLALFLFLHPSPPLSLSRDHKRTQFHTSRTRSRSLVFVPRHPPPRISYEYSLFPSLPASLSRLF